MKEVVRVTAACGICILTGYVISPLAAVVTLLLLAVSWR